MELMIPAVCAFILISNLLLAFFRGTRKSLLRLGTAVLAAVVAFFVARAIAAGVGDELALWLKDAAGGDAALTPLFEGEAGADKALGTLLEMLVSPILFLLLFWVLKGILFLLYWLLNVVTRPEAKDGVATHFIALPIGIVVAFISIFAFLSPIMGYLDVASAAVSEMDTGNSIEQIEQLSLKNTELLLPARQTPIAAPLYDSLGVKLFEELTAGEWDGETLHLKTELITLGKVAGNTQLLFATPKEQFGEAECAAVSALTENISSSHMLSVLCSGILNTAATHWLAGRDFWGLPTPDIGANGNLLLSAFLRVFATSTRDNISEDLDFFGDVFVLAVRYEIFAAFGTADEEALAALITNTGFLGDTQALIDAHPRMQPVGVALVDVGMRSALKAMGLPENVGESCNEILSDMTAVLKDTPRKEDGTIDDAALAEKLTEVFEENEIAIGESSVTLVAQGVADHFTAEELEGLTEEETLAELIKRFEGVDISGLVATIPPEA